MSPLNTPPLSIPIRTGDDFIFENPAVSHQLGVDRNDMVAPGKNHIFLYNVCVLILI
jgi:hypothetical protein